MFPLGCIEDKCLVNCGDFPGDCRSIYGMISAFRCLEYEEGLFEVTSYRFMAMEVIVFR